MKYSKLRTIKKAAPPLFPILFGEVVSAFSTIPRADAYAIGAALLSVYAGAVNWWKNRKRAV